MALRGIQKLTNAIGEKSGYFETIKGNFLGREVKGGQAAL